METEVALTVAAVHRGASGRAGRACLVPASVRDGRASLLTTLTSP